MLVLTASVIVTWNFHWRDDIIYRNIVSNRSLKFGTFLIIVALIASAMAVLFVLHMDSDESSAQIINSGQCGPNATYNIYSDGTLEITGSGEMYQYDTVRAPWYEYHYDITKIIIGDNITKLGTWAFIKCKQVTELTIPITLNSVVSDMYAAFAGINRIEKINFTCGDGGYGYNYAAYEGFDSWYQMTPWYQSRNTLTEIIFADGVKGIGSDAFRELNITSLVIPDSVVHLGNHCFYNCTELTELTIPVSLNSYGSNDDYPAFNGCMAVQKVTFTNGNGVPFDYYDWDHVPKNVYLTPWNMNPDVPKTIIITDSVTSLGKEMFRVCNIKDLTIPISIDYGSSRAFYVSYDNLENVTITKGTSGVGYNYDQTVPTLRIPWNKAPNLKTVTIEEGVTYIGDRTFYNCNTKNVILPNSLTSFGKYVFETCKIQYLTMPISLNAVWLDNSPAFHDLAGLRTINFTPGSGYGFDYAAYKGSNCWYQLTPWFESRATLREVNFSEGITHIGSDAFRELYITTMVIPNTVESLGCHTFYMLTYLTYLTLPITLDSVASSKYPAFDQIYYLTNVRYTVGTDGIGHDYTDVVPFWNYPYNIGFTMTFDKGIKYIGTNTVPAYIFADANGQQMEPTAANLSGHVFRGGDSPWLYLIGDSPNLSSETPDTSCIPNVECINVDPSVKIDSIVKIDPKHTNWI